jgi:hypothetical protein
VLALLLFRSGLTLFRLGLTLFALLGYFLVLALLLFSDDR